MSAADARGTASRDVVDHAVRAFSGHRFGEVYDRIAPDARWVVRGGTTYDGRDAIVAACEETLTELEGGTSEFERFVVIVDGWRAAVDVVARYRDAAGDLTVVSSCDLYEFEDGEISRITSYNFEIDVDEQ